MVRWFNEKTFSDRGSGFVVEIKEPLIKAADKDIHGSVNHLTAIFKQSINALVVKLVDTKDLKA